LEDVSNKAAFDIDEAENQNKMSRVREDRAIEDGSAE